MTTPEGQVKERLKRMLRKHAHVYWHCPVMNGMGSPTLDFICCVNGRYFAIETKAPGKHATERQKQTMKEIRDAGGYVFEVSTDEHIAKVEAYINALHP